MIYVTLKVQPKSYQVTLDDIFNGGINPNVLNSDTPKRTGETRTLKYEQTPSKLLDIINLDEMINSLELFVETHKNLINVEDKSALYRSFRIPKKSGGLRKIDAPLDDLKNALNELKTLLENKLYASHHTSAYAYIKGRCILDNLKKHQQNNSRWYLKLDFSDFFGSTTPQFIKQQLKQIFPFCEIYRTERGEKALDSALSLCFLNGGLPQGTPISPVLTNLMMIPIDFELSKVLREHTPHIVYTRYADDILLSSDLSFENNKDIYCINANSKLKKNLKQREIPKEIPVNGQRRLFDPKADNSDLYNLVTDERLLNDMRRWESSCEINIDNKTYQFNPKTSTETVYKALDEMIDKHIAKTNTLKMVLEVLKKHKAPFTLSNHKTRYGNFNGSNWNLGLMINNKNEITVGHQKKKLLKASLFQFMTDYKNGNRWSLSDTQHLAGVISYYKMIEKETIDGIINKYSEKFNESVNDVIKYILGGCITTTQPQTAIINEDILPF